MRKGLKEVGLDSRSQWWMLNRQIKKQLDIGGEDKLDQQTLGDKDVLDQYGRMRDVQANMVGLLTF